MSIYRSDRLGFSIRLAGLLPPPLLSGLFPTAGAEKAKGMTAGLQGIFSRRGAIGEATVSGSR